jgi:hypothetical protein
MTRRVTVEVFEPASTRVTTTLNSEIESHCNDGRSDRQSWCRAPSGAFWQWQLVLVV